MNAEILGLTKNMNGVVEFNLHLNPIIDKFIGVFLRLN